MRMCMCKVPGDDVGDMSAFWNRMVGTMSKDLLKFNATMARDARRVAASVL